MAYNKETNFYRERFYSDEELDHLDREHISDLVAAAEAYRQMEREDSLLEEYRREQLSDGLI